MTQVKVQSISSHNFIVLTENSEVCVKEVYDQKSIPKTNGDIWR
jgi:hypothetical protein